MLARRLFMFALIALAPRLIAGVEITASTIHGNWQGYYIRPKSKPEPEPMLANFRVDGVEFEGKFYLYPKLPKKKKFPSQEFKLRDGETDVAKGSVLFDRMIAKKKPSPCSGVFSHRGLILEGTCQEGKGKSKFKIWRTQDQGDSSMVYMDQQNFDYFLKMAQDWDKGIGLPWYFADAPAQAPTPVQEQPTAVPTLEPTPTTVAADPGKPSMAGEWDVQLLLPGDGPQPMEGYWELTQTGDEFSGTGSDGAHELKLEQGKLNADGVFRVNRIIDIGVGPAEKTPFYGRLSADGNMAKGSWLMHDQSTKSIFTMRRRTNKPAAEAQP